ncbi:MAG TPA: hypothetical protein VGB79_13650 [Allosphingosinicella sp.]|jgi:hypothetical protein
MTKLTLGDGAQFTVYISPHNDTAKVVTDWVVTFTQGNWTGQITSKQGSGSMLKTPNLAGVFNLVAVASGPNMKEQKLLPLPSSPADIGCNNNCASMVTIVANEDGTGANYGTTWDIYCKPNPKPPAKSAKK